MVGSTPVEVPAELVGAAIAAADDLGRYVSDVPIGVIATRAGVSRSTLLRRLGGTRQSLHDAVRAAGVDPDGPALRDRALAAAAQLIGELGVGHVTLEAIAARARCSVDSLYATIGSRDLLLAAVFEAYSPLADMDAAMATDLALGTDLLGTVEHMYRRLVAALLREPQLTPALVAEALSRPDSAVVRSVSEQNSPRLIGPVRAWLEDRMSAGEVRRLPLDLLLSQLLAPVLLYTALRPALGRAERSAAVDTDQACRLFADAFVRAVGCAVTAEPRLSPS